MKDYIIERFLQLYTTEGSLWKRWLTGVLVSAATAAIGHFTPVTPTMLTIISGGVAAFVPGVLGEIVLYLKTQREKQVKGLINTIRTDAVPLVDVKTPITDNTIDVLATAVAGLNTLTAGMTHAETQKLKTDITNAKA